MDTARDGRFVRNLIVTSARAFLLTTCLCSAMKAEMVTRRLGTPPKGPAGAPARKVRVKLPTAYAVETKTPPTLDGKLTEKLWSQAPALRLARTLDGSGPAAQPTEVRLVRHNRNLYVGVRAFEPMLSKLEATRRGHDGAIWSDDSIEIFLGTGGRYWHFGVNAAGSTYDAQAKDASWNSGFRAAVSRGRNEYIIEAVIPLEKMGGEKLPTEWTANFNRNRRTTGTLEEASWSPTYSGDSHVPSRFGKLLLKSPPKTHERKQPEVPVLRRQQLEVLPASNGAGVARFDLSALPKGAKIYRADLLVFRTTKIDGRLDEALVNVEVYPLYASFSSGDSAKAAGEPLPIRGPWHDRLDATEAVAQWLAGKTNGGFFFKACPFWRAEATCLDIWYEGDPARVPPQVTGVKAVHRAGQTFITWREIDDPVGKEEVTWGELKSALDNLDQAGRTRYCVYRHNRRITADNLHEAELIATVKPLSCWNVNGRSLDRAIDLYIATADQLMVGHWNPFWQAEMDGKYGRDCPIDRLVIADGAEPLPPGTGLYVHTPGREGEAYYAVVTSVNGVQNTKDLTAANSLDRPVEEIEGIGEPVLQKTLPKMPFFNYDQKRLHYVRWVAPPLVNVPSQYYNWSVGVPVKLGKDVPLEVNFHRDGRSYWRTHYRIERDSIVLCPHDFPVNSWWYGYHEALGTLKSFRQGRIRPYTERRLLAFIEWAARNWPVDPDRILVTGCRGGASGSGALHLGLRHPEVFSLVISGHGSLDYRAEALRTDRQGRATAQSMQAIWGRPEWDIPTEGGGSFWQGHDMLRLVTSTPAKRDLPFVTLTSRWDSAHKFYGAMLATHRGVIGHFAWGGTRYVPVSASGTYPNVIRADLARDKPYPAIAYAKGMEGIGNNRALNTEFRWRDIVDTPDRFEVTLSGGPNAGVNVGLRRVQNFQIRPGRTYAWTNKLLPDAKLPRPPRNPKPNTLAAGGQSGQVTVGDDGVLAIEGVEIQQVGSRLIVTAK